LAVVAIGAALVLGACKSGPDAAGGTGNGPAGGAAAGGGGPAAGGNCIVGTWKLTGAEVTLSMDGSSMKLNGGAGAILTVGADGATTVDYSNAKPIAFTGSMHGGQQAAGTYTYTGKVIASMAITPGAGTSGSWKPKGKVDLSSVTVTEDITSPMQMRVLDHVSLADAGNDTTGNSSSILSDGTYECGGSTLKLTPKSGSTTMTGTWTFQRA
jgi:hypothetical protein